MKLYQKTLQALILIVVGLGGLQTSRADVLFYNLNLPVGTFSSAGGSQIGDEVVLADLGHGATITNFSFGLYAKDVDSSATYTISLYANDGDPSFSGPKKPGSLLWSDTYNFGSVSTTFNSMLSYDATGLGGGVVVPSSFTWAITLTGLGSGDAGLILTTNAPSIGMDYNDYWLNNGSDWTLNLNPAYNVNFLSTFEGNPNPVPEPTSVAMIGLGIAAMVAFRRFATRRV